MSRYIGLFRPPLFRSNSFYVFHTNNVRCHYDGIRSYINKKFPDIELVDDIFPVPRAKLIYSRNKYQNYNQIHKKLVTYLSNGNEKNIIISTNKKNWPLVLIDVIVNDELDNIIKKL